VIDAYIQPAGYVKPTQAIANKLETENLKKLYKYDLIGLSTLKNFELEEASWIFNEIDNLNAYYPGLKYFSESLNEKARIDQLQAISTHVFIGEGTLNSPYIFISKDDMNNLANLVRYGYTI